MTTDTRRSATPDPTRPTGTVVVLGGSLGGLLAAAALAPHVGRVLVVDRDPLGDDPAPRPGTPQATHAHGLLASGRLAVESLLPGFTDQLVDAGAVSRGDIGSNGRWYVGGRLVADCEVGANGVAASRLLVESTVRRRVRSLAGVEVRDRTAVTGLVAGADHRSVTGVRLHDVVTGTDEVVLADLVVDATGRPGRAGRWFAEHGWPAPAEERVDVGVRYATTHVEARDGDLDGRSVVVSAATPEVPRGGVAIRQEGDRWVVMLFGYVEDQPPLDPDGFRRHARSVVAPELAELVADRPLLEAPRAYRYPHCVRRRVERCDLPRGYVAVGDAVCSFDPTFGQGMSVAALEAVALGRLARDAGDLAAVGGEYHREAASVVDRAWLVVVGADVQIPGVVGAAPPGHAVTSRWVRAVQRAAHDDPAVARALMRVTNLLEPPSSLMRPAVAARLVRHAARRRPAQGTSTTRPDAVPSATEAHAPATSTRGRTS